MFGFPIQPREKNFRHKKSLLRTAIFQLKYPQAKIRENNEDLEKQLISRFPVKKHVTASEAKIKFESSKTPILESASAVNEGFEFRTEDEKKIFRITSEAFSYTVLGEVYTNFEGVQNEIQKFLFPALEICGIKTISWVSTRKINILEPSVSDDFSSASLLNIAFNEDLISNIIAFPKPGMVKSGVSQVTFKTSGYRLNLNYGLLPKPPAGKIDKPQIILDIDLISESQFQIRDIIPEWQKVNREIYNIFSWAISEQLKVSLDTKEAM